MGNGKFWQIWKGELWSGEARSAPVRIGRHGTDSKGTLGMALACSVQEGNVRVRAGIDWKGMAV